MPTPVLIAENVNVPSGTSVSTIADAPPGSLIVAFVYCWSNSNVSLTGFSDSVNGAYADASQPSPPQGGVFNCAIFFLENSGADLPIGSQLTATVSDGSLYGVWAYAVSGYNGGLGLAASGSDPTTSLTSFALSLGTIGATDIVFGNYEPSNGNVAGFASNLTTFPDSELSQGIVAAYGVPGAGPFTWSASWSFGNGGQSLNVVSFKATPTPTVQPWFESNSATPGPLPRRASAFLRGDDGTQVPLIAFRNPGALAPPWQPPRLRAEKRGAVLRGDDGTQRPFAVWRNAGWEVQPPPPKPRARRMVGWPDWNDDGNESPIPRPVTWGYETPITALFRKRKIVGWPDWNDDGNEAPFVPPTTVVNWGYEQPAVPLLRRKKIVGFPDWNDDGNEGTYAVWVNSGWEVQPPQPPQPKPMRGAILRGEDGIEGPLAAFYPFGWPIILPQPPHPRPERSAAIARGDDGAEASFVAWQNAGWEIQPFQLPHPRPERAGSLARGDDGTAAAFQFFYPAGWAVQAWQPPHPRPERFGSITRGDDGTAAPFQVFVALGWPVQPLQPPHPRPERAGAIMRGDDGDQAIFFVKALPAWFEGPFVFPRFPFQRAAAIARGDDGTQSPLIRFFPAGWPVDAFTPKHPRPERWAAIAPHDDGAEARFSPAVLFPWQESPLVYPRIRFERAAAVARGSDGIERPFVIFRPSGWGPIDFTARRTMRRMPGGGSDFALSTTVTIPAFPIFDFPTPLRARRMVYADAAGINLPNQLVQWVYFTDFSLPLIARRRPATFVLESVTQVTVPSSAVVFRKTLAEFGTGVGKRQMVETI